MVFNVTNAVGFTYAFVTISSYSLFVPDRDRPATGIPGTAMLNRNGRTTSLLPVGTWESEVSAGKFSQVWSRTVSGGCSDEEYSILYYWFTTTASRSSGATLMLVGCP